MAIYRKLLEESFLFNEDTPDKEILYERYIHQLLFGLVFKQTGTTAPSLSDVFSVLSKIELKLRGTTITEVTAQDLAVIDWFLFKKEPLYSLPSADGEYGYVQGLILPVTVPAGSGTLAYRLYYTAPSTITDYRISIERIDSDDVLEPGIYAIKRFDYTPPSTGTENIAIDTSFDGDLIAMLIYSPTIPTASSNSATVKKIILEEEGAEMIKDTIYTLRTDIEYPKDSTLRGICDNYIFLDFRRSPIARGRRIRLKIVSDDTNTCKIIPILKI